MNKEVKEIIQEYIQHFNGGPLPIDFEMILDNPNDEDE